MVARLLREKRIEDPRLMWVFLRVRRHRFVPQHLRMTCYQPYAHDTVDGQTLTCPDFVAQMVSLLALKKTDNVLEVGTGTGFQTAILNAMAGSVTTIEVLASLHEQAKANLARRHTRVQVRLGDGATGAPDRAPFDAIVLGCATEVVPDALLDQLAVGGRLVAPVGDPARVQALTVIRKTAAGLERRKVRAAWFVPMT